MTTFRAEPGAVDPAVAADRLSKLGFLAIADLPDRNGPGLLLVAIRPRPTLRHFDPETIEYWTSHEGRGVRRTIGRDTPTPIDEPFSWGLIRLADRLGVTNEYLAFGGRIEADRVEDSVVVRFVSSAPILRRGGHSQGVDAGAETLGAWFGRLLLAVDVRPGFEAELAAADPLVRYAAFLQDALERLHASAEIRSVYGDLACLLGGEADRLQREHPDTWRAGLKLRPEAAPRPPQTTPVG